jgi:hypothetical protein
MGRDCPYMGGERLGRAGALPTRSGPEGSSRNKTRLGRVQPLTLFQHTLFQHNASRAHLRLHCGQGSVQINRAAQVHLYCDAISQTRRIQR